MREGAGAARRMLTELRNRRGTDLAVLAGVIEASIPTSQPARTEFYMVLADYLIGAMDGAAPDVDSLPS
jgi:hypothetical protein